MDKFSFISNAEPEALDKMYQDYLKNPDLVDKSWKEFFEGFDFARTNYNLEEEIPAQYDKEFKVINLINGYRTRGHLFTKTNPVRTRRKYEPTLAIENYGLSESDLDTVFQAGKEIGLGPATLRDIIAKLNRIYCQSIGVEFMYIREPKKIEWFKNKLEIEEPYQFSKEERKHILHKLNQAVVFEQFLHKKFVGQKRFSLEGEEALIPALDTIVEKGSKIGVQEFVIGMAHRGRLNVLANIFNKTYEAIFSEFEGKEYEDNLFDGDVKYHLGYSCDVVADSGVKVHMTLAPNPSHLEAVDPVVEGITRSKIDKYLKDEKKIVPILIHGDAAIAGQGVVYEVIQMAQLEGYRNGGTIHLVANNQVGFTTNYLDGRSSTYCTDVGKVTLSPVFHVNGDDVEAVLQAVMLALEFRQEFGQDVFIDILGYRKYGHNEGDEPRFTQPILYKAIAKHENPRDIYIKKLVEAGVISKSEAKEEETKFNNMLQERLDESKQIEKAVVTHFMEHTWEGFRKAVPEDFEKTWDTTFSLEKLRELGVKVSELPSDKKFIRKINKIFDERKKMVVETDKLDWAMGETLAYATLLSEGHPVRISGQDVERGTFSHRHAVVKVEDSEEEYIPLKHIDKNQAPFYIYNSLLSEYGVLGFEYGYAFGTPEGLTIWEAQFGDFNNGAQIIIDQFITSAEEKWRTQNGLVMYLPHGYEGQGAEHSSARMERFLLMCAEYNIIAANCTTPANFYHLLRRQLKFPFRKPLIIFTPKSLLRHPLCTSTLEELANGSFQEVLDDTIEKDKVNTVVLCTGKFYYDLLEERNKNGVEDIAFVRVEQLYPYPEKQLHAILDTYKNAKKFVWAQEEPENMGAWIHMMRRFKYAPLECVALRESGAPATGSHKAHVVRHQEIINKVFQYSLVEK
tara:strand:+ start:105649 stop:108369 length:2721 start_codon:yes stop_codon:yes gene_type:complete